MDSSLIILVLLLAIAFFYASVGHGGASGYLAVLGLMGADILSIKSSALILNLFVSAIAFYEYYKAGHFRWKLFYPFALPSIPFAFLGGSISLDPFWYKKILGICLIVAVVRIISTFIKKEGVSEGTLPPFFYATMSGAIIGLISGMIGIGGGIILSPLILIMKWGNVKEAAATSALFIFVNSLAGLLGVSNQKLPVSAEIYLWIAAAVAGGIAGAYWGSIKAPGVTVKNILAAVLLFAAVKLLFI